MASELPLVLCDCHFSEEDLDWVIEADCREENIRHFQKIWPQHAIKAAIVKQMLEGLNSHKVETEGARGVMVIVAGNEHGDTSSNPGRDSLHFTLH